MDNHLLKMLSHSLFELESLADLVDELLIPRQPVAGENAGKAVTSKGSKVPLSTSMLDMKIAAEAVLSRWCSELARDSECGPPPISRRINVRAGWLQAQLFLLDAMPWGEVCAEEIIAETRLLRDVTMGLSQHDDPKPIEIGSAREIVGWARHLGYQISRSTVQRWIDAQLIASELAADGRILIRLEDVIERLRGRGLGSGPPPEVHCV